MDNRMFNINGQGSKMLLDTLKLAFLQSGFSRAEGYVYSKETGLILVWSHLGDRSDFHPFPAKLSAEQVLPIVEAWLASDEAADVVVEDGEEDLDHDGHNTVGWRLYCEGWGHVGSCRQAIIGVKRCHLWHGK